MFLRRFGVRLIARVRIPGTLIDLHLTNDVASYDYWSSSIVVFRDYKQGIARARDYVGKARLFPKFFIKAETNDWGLVL